MNATTHEEINPQVDHDAPVEHLQINPQVLRGVRPLPGLDEIEVTVIQAESAWVRWAEGLTIHVVAGVLAVAILSFTAANETPKQQVICIPTTSSGPEDIAE